MTSKLIIIILFIGTITNAQQFDWAKQYSEFYREIALSPEGQVLATGNKILAAKLNADGGLLWQKKYSSSYINGSSIAQNGSEIFICGTFYGTNKVEDTTIVAKVGEGFIARLDTAGNFKWIKQSTSANASFNKIVTDKNGNIYLSGNYKGAQMQFGGLVVESKGENDAFIAKMNANGNVEWVKTLGTEGNDHIYDIEITTGNTLILTGFYHGSGYFGENKLPSAVTKTGLVAYFNPTTFVATFPVNDTSLFYQQMLRHGDNYYFSAAFKDEVFIGVDGFTNTSANNAMDGLLVKTDDALQPVWAKHIKGGNINSFAVNKDGSIMAGGSFYKSLQVETKSFTNKGESDIFLASFAPNAQLNWAIQPSSANIDEMLSICADTTRNISFILGAVQSGPVSMGNVSVKGDFSGAPFLARSKPEKLSISNKLYELPSINIYPNPANAKFYIEASHGASEKLTIYSLDGKMIKIENLNSGINTIDVSNLPNGLYIISVISEGRHANRLLQVSH